MARVAASHSSSFPSLNKSTASARRLAEERVRAGAARRVVVLLAENEDAIKKLEEAEVRKAQVESDVCAARRNWGVL